MSMNKRQRPTFRICLVAVLIITLLLQISSSGPISVKAEIEPDSGYKLMSTVGIIITDANVASYSSSGSGNIDDPYIIDNLFINTTDSLAVDFDSITVHFVLRDSYLKGSTYGVYFHATLSGEASIINCTIEGALSIGGPNAHYLTVYNNTLRFNQGSNYRRGLNFTKNLVYTTSSYSTHLMRVRDEDNIIKDNDYYGNASQVIFQDIRNSTIENNVLHSAGFDIREGDITDISNNTFENNIVNGKLHGFFYNRTGDTITGNQYGQIYIVNSINTKIEGQTMEDTYAGIQVHNCSDITIDNVIVSGKNGIEIKNTHGLLIQNCVLEGFRTGIEFYTATDVIVQNNHMTKYQIGIECNFIDGIQINNNTIVEIEETGIYFEDNWNIDIMFNIISCDIQISGSELTLAIFVCENVTIYYNVFISLGNLTAPPVEESSCTNIMWYDETLEVGNYYSDWNETGTYAIPGNVGSEDLYPFIDIDEDTLNEFDEVVIYFTDPFSADSDSDGLNDGEEINTYETNPLSDDSDSDGMDDLWEVTYGTDPNTDDATEDPDEDGLTNIEEFNLNTLPMNNDTDGDGYLDGEEVEAGTDPLNSSSFP
ncbi:MAG: right-handed parallel beta-helix repeat-containing protein, partial [Candidatus Heimdallarchaeota archaeon]|nr:right-handed parallel beta-helix repeat-containing protein [Candidatus Heimdallarchaeota archaeon]